MTTEGPQEKAVTIQAILGRSLIVAGLLLGMSLLTTYWFVLRYEGAPGLHWPFQWIDWGLRYGLLQEGFSIWTGGSALLLGLYAALLMRKRPNAIEGLHGSAHWATPKEVRASGLLPTEGNTGVYVGGWKERRNGPVRYLRHSGPEHVLAFAPTRSGKGVGLVLPTLLSWRESAIVYDIKGENWALTAGWRQREAGNKVLRFDPTAEDGTAFNPLAEIRIGAAQEVSDAQNIATMLVDPDGKGLSDHWAKTSYALLTGAILHCRYAIRVEANRTASLADVERLLSDPSREQQEVLELMMDFPHRDGEPHPVVAQEARSLLNKSENERSGVVSTALSFLSLYRDPLVAKNTAQSDFRISDLINLESPVTLYLVVRPSDADRLRPLIRLVLTQIVRRLTEKMDFSGGRSVAHYTYRLLLLIDEFASLKRLTVVEEALAYMAGYGLKAYLIVQDLQQIFSAYGREEGLTGNCHIRIAYAPNKLETAEILSRMAGTTTVMKRAAGIRKGTLYGHGKEAVQEVQRPLITPDEVMRLPGMVKDAKGKITETGHMLIFVAGQAPIYGRQILYFQDEVFSERAAIPPPTQSDRIPDPEPPRPPQNPPTPSPELDSSL